MGVRRALEKVLSDANRGEERIFTYGPLIHNNQVLDLLESKGIVTVEDVSHLENATLVIRAHGISPEQRKLLRSSGLRLLDATCPQVARVQSIIRYHTRKEYTAVIVGDADHPEVIGLIGYGRGRAHVINHPSEVSSLPAEERLFVVAQTTQDGQNYAKVVQAIKNRFPDALVFDTICDATYQRQEEVKSFAKQVDGLVVVGGFHSGNTKRLIKVSKAAGLPCFHVETEKDLDREKLSTMEVIGVTAGASTPNWMIKNVVKEIEAIRGRKDTVLGRWIKRGLKFLLLSNLLVAMGGFSLTYAAMILSGRAPDMSHPSLAFLYIYAMHVLNRFLDKGASAYNDPESANFCKKNKRFLILTGLISIFGALVVAYVLGTAVFLAIAGISVLGIIYSIPIIPLSTRHLWRYSKIKDIPGSKTFSQAFAWGAVITLLPLLESLQVQWPATLLSFFLVFSLVSVRSALYDIFQVQGDLIVGVETLPIILGEKRTLMLLKWLLLVSSLLLVAAPLFKLVEPFSFLLLFPNLSLILSLSAYEKRWLYPGTHMEIWVELNFFVAGLMGLIWHYLA